MQDETETGSGPMIYSAIASIMADVDAIPKIQHNEFLDYPFRGIDDVYNALHRLFVRHKVFTTSEILEQVRSEWVNEQGTLMIEYALKVRYTFHAQDGSFVTSETMGQAMDSSDKAGNKAMTMSHKTALLQLFMVPTSDDPDADTPQPRAHYQQPASMQPMAPQQQVRPANGAAYQQGRPVRPAASAQQNGYHPPSRQRQASAPPVQGRGGSGLPNNRPATAKQIQYLRDLAARSGVSREDAQGVEEYIALGMTGDQCSGMIDAINAYLSGTSPAIFQVAESSPVNGHTYTHSDANPF